MSTRRFLAALFIASHLTAGTVPPAAAASAKPSFDCRRASTWSEKAICADAGLAALDRRIDKAFSAAMKRLPAGPSRAALQADQTAFLAIRDWLDDRFDGDPREALRGHLGDREAFLNRVRPVPDGDLVGTWANAWGEFEIRPRDREHLRMYGAVTEPFTARWTCAVDEIGRRQGDLLRFVPAGGEDWRMTVSMEGGTLWADGLSGTGDALAGSFCGGFVSVDEIFFHVGPISDAEPEQW